MNNRKYDAIMGRTHHTSPSRRHMTMHERAAQFAPFAALTGYDSAVGEAARLTDCRLEPDEDMAARINERLNILQGYSYGDVNISVELFVPDQRKQGGAYVTKHGTFKRLNLYDRLLELYGDIRIPFDDIYRIDGEIFG